MQKALIKHFISSGVQEGQPKLWNVTSLFQWNESDGNANFIQAAVYPLGSGERKKKVCLVFSLSGENTHHMVLLPWPLSLLLETLCLLQAALLPPHWFLPPAPPNTQCCPLSLWLLNLYFHFHRLCEFSLACKSQQKPFMAGSSEPSQSEKPTLHF